MRGSIFVMLIFAHFLMREHEEIQRVLFKKVPETRKALLAVEIERVAQVCPYDNNEVD